MESGSQTHELISWILFCAIAVLLIWIAVWPASFARTLDRFFDFFGSIGKGKWYDGIVGRVAADGSGSNKERETMEKNEKELTEKLKDAGKKAVAEQKAKREKVVPGAHLVDPMKAKVDELKLTSEEIGGFIKVTGTYKGRHVYLAKKGGRADLSGFSAEADGIVQISEEEAKAKHVGKVRGTVDFGKDDATVLAAWTMALAKLTEAMPPAPEKKVRAKKEPKTADATTAPTDVPQPETAAPTEAPKA